MQEPIFYSLGIRRKKESITLDVLYPEIKQIESANAIPATLQPYLPQGDTLFTVLSSETIQTLQPTWGKSAPETYFQTDWILFVLPTKSKAVIHAEEAYFKLQLLSQRLVKPHELCLEGLFGKLENIAWTNYGPILPKDVDLERVKYHSTNTPLLVQHLDKFPHLLNYHIPSGVRVAEGSRVRLGAYLGEGTTIMPAGFVNFNAGTEGNTMVEGRISAGVTVAKDSDIGGGASIMGTLSGGNNHVISIGSKCLLGANSGTGISLGFGCTIQAGLYITAGMKIYMYDAENNPINNRGERVKEGQNVVKAANLSGKDYLLFMDDSVSGRVICKPNQKTIELNSTLHAN